MNVEREKPIDRDVNRAAARWFAERETGEWSAADEERLGRWLDADPEHVAAFARAETLWASMDAVGLPIHTADAEVVPLPSTRPAVPRSNAVRQPVWRKTRLRRAGGAIAAGIALLLVIAADLPTRLQADAMTGTGEIRAMTLPDGSLATLDTGTAISFDASGRKVTLLKGEAAFQVAPDPAHPFTVSAGTGSTTALGTRFIVRREGAETQVTVSEHSVRIASAGRSAVLHEGEALHYGSGGISAARPVVVANLDAWTRGRIRVVNRPLGDVVAELARYHRGYIGVLGSEIAKRPVSGTFDLHDPAGAIDVIERTLGLRTTRLTDRLILIHG
ncbi:iron dicitrate transporter FecR [Novosphingobium sp. TCA1]|nr:iron dicitrate transporter FecR [Novosphingobium sp. TCA1]